MPVFDKDFPSLRLHGFQSTSPPTPAYNCIAWAAGDAHRFWWPDPSCLAYWPPHVPRKVQLDSFVAAYSSLGYAPCDTGNHEHGVEKIALYALNGIPTHAARQLANGYWTSKLGRNIDIQHTLSGLVGPLYGEVALFMSRNST